MFGPQGRRIFILLMLFACALMQLAAECDSGNEKSALDENDEIIGDLDDDDDDDDTTDDDTADDDTADDDTVDDDTGDDDIEVTLPVTPEVLVSGFDTSEGIAFVPETNRMFIVAKELDVDHGGVYEVFADGSTAQFVELNSPVGMVYNGDGLLLVGEFGDDSGVDTINDGSVMAVDLAEQKAYEYGDKIPDANFLVLRPDGSVLVSDDFSDKIYEVPNGGGDATNWLKGDLVYSNGMVFAPDGMTLYVARSFKNYFGPIPVPDNRIFQVSLDSPYGDPVEATLLAEVGDKSTPDGLAMDENGKIYVCANTNGTVIRFDPITLEQEVVAEDLGGVASLAWGTGGDFPETTLYATRLFAGEVVAMPIGVRSAKLGYEITAP
ncbi:MAG: SMP-30/gluconolactonase/LRE family protein [Deltaproteobacteria bacterium]|nr:SMP-30/gluconolactonase/LRE family protein [Deltaproteobacteria bacterium]MCB9479329.1 SMP-30/gluconolactonase/LRE family protein [Deltaproteobacteria bacterium]MCB9488774.1 SMP-30/gluconolactonase/LRE family protein [Deltaproteobacteria bacterium]